MILMREDLNQRIDQLKDDIVKSTQKLIQAKSVEMEAEEGMPFGPGVNEALETALQIAGLLNLKTKNVDGYAAHVEVGEGEELVGVLCHLDVVPEGKNWTYPPYGGEIHDGKIYGRGTIDNKGPAVAALYALKAIQDCGYQPQKRIRLILGTDEESGWQGLEYYFQHEEKPTVAFSPDAEYPVIFAEKGIMIFKLHQEFSPEKSDGIEIKSIKGGNAPNMVPDYCEAVIHSNDPELIKVKLSEFTAETGYQLELLEDGATIKIESHGVSAHGSLPADGKNAISQLMLFLNRLEIKNQPGRLIKFYCDKIGMEYYGESIGCALSDEISGQLIFNVGVIEVDQSKAELLINIRYPVTLDSKEVYQRISQELDQTGIKIEEKEDKKPLYVEKDDPLVTKLMQVYREFTNDQREAIAIGGGTYARVIDKAVAFGPLFPGQPELAHQKDEYIGIDDLILNTKIIANAILELAN